MAYADNLFHVKLENSFYSIRFVYFRTNSTTYIAFWRRSRTYTVRFICLVDVIKPSFCNSLKDCPPSLHGGSLCPLRYRLPQTLFLASSRCEWRDMQSLPWKNVSKYHCLWWSTSRYYLFATKILSKCGNRALSLEETCGMWRTSIITGWRNSLQLSEA
jgi:hypothetical protein